MKADDIRPSKNRAASERALERKRETEREREGETHVKECLARVPFVEFPVHPRYKLV